MDGNPCVYKDNVLKWERGRLLAAYGDNKYSYDADGVRIKKKTANGILHKYFTEGTRIHHEEYGTHENWYYYDATGIVGIEHDGVRYYFQKNIQGDVARIFNANGYLVARYVYDAWGNHTVYDSNGNINTDENFIGNINPFRYRGYYYDIETGLYYLNTRYYDPFACRFINADDISYIEPETINGLNLYSYCGNNPVMGVDPNGTAWWNPFTWNWNEILTGMGLVVTAAAAVTLSVVTFGAGTPLAIGIIAGVTLGAGLLTGINGIATIGAGISGGYNFMRDGLFNSVLGLNDNAYDIYAGVVECVAVFGSAILGVYNMTGRAKAARYGRKFLGNGYNKVEKGRWVSADGLRQMIFDNTHHILDGVRTTTHFNLYTHATNLLAGKSKIIAKLHVFYNLFKIWFR